MDSVEGDGGPEPGDSALGDKPSAIFHALPSAYFDELAHGRGSRRVINYFWLSERSRRLVLLRAFHDDINGDSRLIAELPATGETWCVLEKAQSVAPERFAELLMVPQVGSWLAYVLRRRRGGADSLAPEHIDYGHINSIALAAAAMAQLSFATKVPLRDGRVVIPCFGMAFFDGCEPWEMADAGVADGRIWLRHRGCDVQVPPTPGTDADGWWGLRRLSLGNEPKLNVWLEDLDPMRDMADPVPPVRLSDAGVAQWTSLLDRAWEILCDVQPELADALAAGVTSFVPLPPADGWDTRSASTGDAFGAILCSPPPDAVTLAVALAHEFMHIKLGGLMHLISMSHGGEEACLYAPWRDDPRPLGGLIQGVYAFVGIAAFWRSYRARETGLERDLADFEYVYARAQAKTGMAIACSAAGVTPPGQAFLDELKIEIDSWDDDEITDEIASLARLVADSHRAGWLIRHCHPDPVEIAELAAAWADGSTHNVHIGQSIVRPDPAMRHWSQARLGLARRRIVARDQYRQSRAETWGAALTDGDLALFAGEADQAGKHYREQIACNSGAVDAWTGLGLALSSDRSSDSNRLAGMTILDRPEVVLAVYLRAAATSPQPPSAVDLAAWVGAVST